MTEPSRERRRFRWSFKQLLPSWLREGEGEAIWYSIGWIVDGALWRYYWALLSRFPSFAPIDSFPFFEQDRKIHRSVGLLRDPLDPAARASYVTRLHGWLDAARVRGGAFAALTQIREFLGGDGIRIRWVDANGNWYTIDRDGSKSYKLGTGNWQWDTVPNPPNWARFWIIIYPRYDAESATFSPWDQPPPFDGSWFFDGSFVWGSTATPEEMKKLLTIVEDEKPSGTRQEWIVYYYHDDAGPEPDAFDPDSPAPDGTWWAWGSGDPRDLNRAIEAAYIKAGPVVTPDGAMEPS
jgi:hypothetical protein